MNCPRCNCELKEFEKNNEIIVYCTECWGFINYKFSICDNHELRMVRVNYQNGSTHLRQQCLKCGQMKTTNFKKTEIENWQKLPLVDIESPSSDFYSKHEEMVKRYNKKGMEARKSKNYDDFLGEHNEYLNSIQWKTKREKVLQRDNFLCQSCLESKANEVHHKTYRFWKNEPLFDLVSVCIPCHEKITIQTREIFDFDKLKREGNSFVW